MSVRTTVLVVDDQALVRETLALWLRTAPDLEIVGCAAHADEAVTLATEKQPRVVLMDVDMPGRQAFEAARVLRARCPDARILFVSGHTQDRYIEQALAVGAAGYVAKSEPAATLLGAIRTVATSGAYFSPVVRARLVFAPDGVQLAEQARTRATMLTERETEVLRHLARGLSKKEIAEVTHLSERTVNRHCANMMAKLDIHDRVALTRFAIREGLVEA
ncbi:MAG: response regulator transcription factor [Phycisphaerae bacterium]|nr:response regulator transcription factor [Phycisphaerae bacterium]HQL54325.1 response regulator transcription factor [Phycisphaerae bacterium]